jgi:hypothetical protein
LDEDILVVTLVESVLVVTNDGVAVSDGVDVTEDSTAIIVTIVVEGGSEGGIFCVSDPEEQPAIKTITIMAKPNTKLRYRIISLY